jgi:FIST N domain
MPIRNFTELQGADSEFHRRNARSPQNYLAAVGFYGAAIRIDHGGAGGWDVFGLKRRVTSAQGNLLFQLDGRAQAPASTSGRREIFEFLSSFTRRTKYSLTPLQLPDETLGGPSRTIRFTQGCFQWHACAFRSAFASTAS